MGLGQDAKLVVLLILTVTYRATSIMLQTSIPLYAKYTLHASDFFVSLIVATSSLFPILSLVYITVKGANVSRGILLSLGAVSCALPLYLLVDNSLLLAILSSFLYFWIGPAGVFLLTAVVLISSGQRRERNVILFTVALSASLILSPIIQAGILRASANDLAISMAVFSPLIGVPLILFARLRQDADLSMKSNFDLSFLKNRSYALGVLSNEIFSIPFTLLLTFGGIFSKNELGVGYPTIESLFTLFFSISLISRLFLTRIKIPKYYLILSVTVATGIGLFLVYKSSSLSELAFSFILLGYSHGIYYPTASNYIADAALRQKFAGANSLSTIIDQIVTSASLPIMGAISGLFGLRLAFLVFEIPMLTLSGVFLQLGWRKPTRRNTI